jgi:hypothetical protein
MKTRAFLLALPLLLVVGCRDNRASLKIQAICAPTNDCTFSQSCDQVYVGYPTLDTTANANGSLQLYFELRNDLPNNRDQSTGRLNTNDAHVDETIVEYVGPGLGAATLMTQHTVPAGGSTVVRIEVIPQVLNAVTALQAYAPSNVPRDMVANLRIRGYYDDGSRFESGEFPVAVRVCQGCVGSICGGAATCPPRNDGQLPLSCVQ